jgi:SAM-dependent methyltransferase
MDTMRKYWPQMYARKIPDSMVQFAFVYDMVLNFDATNDTPGNLLSAGSHEDIATECLKINDFPVVGVDPVINETLRSFKKRLPFMLFDYVVSASVLEHTENDEEFIADACDLLCPGGYGVFTMDFKNDWKPGERLPTTSNRFYTAHDLTVRLPAILAAHNCAIVGEQDYSARDRFQWEGIDYSFATFVFQKAK